MRYFGLKKGNQVFTIWKSPEFANFMMASCNHPAVAHLPKAGFIYAMYAGKVFPPPHGKRRVKK